MIHELNDWLMYAIYNDALLTKAALTSLCGFSLFLLLSATYRKIKYCWECMFFIALCSLLFVWALTSLLLIFGLPPGKDDLLITLRDISMLPVPALLCLHIHRQVSYKAIHPAFVIALFSVSFFDFYIYTAVALLRSYLLCFNVFYQMPKRTRRSTLYMLFGISSFSVLLLIEALLEKTTADLIPQIDLLFIFTPLFAPVAFCLILYTLYIALTIMPASDVIVTSREFVVGSLSTTILVLNNKKRILDWNKTHWDDGYPFPKPLYNEPVAEYRRRMLSHSDCRVSPHDGNIVTAKTGEEEKHFLMHMREVGNSRNDFGYIMEISEVTPIYSILRFFEGIAYYDTLTGLHNRNAYLDYVTKSITEENMPLLIFVGDVNRLKQINDVKGHLAGDRLLVAIADIIKNAMPEGAFAARIGGDEFVMLAKNGGAEMASDFVNDVISRCAAISDEQYGTPSISWGCSFMVSVEQSYNEAFSKADKMMYEYKKAQHTFTSSGLLPE